MKPKIRKPSGCKAYPLTDGHSASDFEGMALTYTTVPSDQDGLYSKGTTVKGKCVDGHVLSHTNQTHIRPLRKKCRRNGTWVGRGDGVKCELITCPALHETGFLSGGVIVLSESCSEGAGGNESISGRLSIKTKCRFSCTEQNRYKLIGSKIARCSKNSKWKLKGGPPKCTERHSYKKKLRKEKRKKSKEKRRKSRRKKRPELKGNEHSHNGRNTAVDDIMESTNEHAVHVSNKNSMKLLFSSGKN